MIKGNHILKVEQRLVIYVDTLIREYIVKLTESTRSHSEISLGASPRASLGLFKTARALALIRDRDYVIPDDVKFLAPTVLSHRVILSSSARMQGLRSIDIVNRLLSELEIPGIPS